MRITPVTWNCYPQLKKTDMPIHPTPTTYTCPACGWSKTLAPQSDALMPGDVFGVCPKCGHEPLDSHEASTARGVLASLTNKVKRVLG